MLYLGVDVHKRSCWVTVLDADGQEREQRLQRWLPDFDEPFHYLIGYIFRRFPDVADIKRNRLRRFPVTKECDELRSQIHRIVAAIALCEL